MANADVVANNIAVFITTLFLLEFGADKFIDHTAIVAQRTGISDTVIGLLTAGGEWEELAVIVASLARGRASLALGNLVGSAISNVLGAFSLGLLFHKEGALIEFDTSSRIYSLFLLILTTFVTPITFFSTKIIWLACGATLIASFAAYIGSVGWAISRGRLIAPREEEEDSDSSDDESRDEDSIVNITETTTTRSSGSEDRPNRCAEPESNRNGVQISHSAAATPTPTTHHQRHSLLYHIFYLVFGFLAICLAGYVLSHAAIAITDEFDISDVLFGVVVLAIATTLPEKFVAVLSGHRGHPGILVANTAGSNIFLLSLCLGIIMLDTSGHLKRGNVNISELGLLWGSTLAFTLTVWFGGKFCRWIGAAMLVGYVVFIVLEFTIIHNVTKHH